MRKACSALNSKQSLYCVWLERLWWRAAKETQNKSKKEEEEERIYCTHAASSSCVATISIWRRLILLLLLLFKLDPVKKGTIRFNILYMSCRVVQWCIEARYVVWCTNRKPSLYFYYSAVIKGVKKWCYLYLLQKWQQQQQQYGSISPTINNRWKWVVLMRWNSKFSVIIVHCWSFFF